jgi:ubiquitin C-terminal hydrolase
MTSRHGLMNVGNTCYLNSALQALCRSQPVRAYFSTDAWKAHRHPDRRGYALTGHVADLVAALQAPGTNALKPVDLVRTFVPYAHDFNEQITFGMQGCAAEAIEILIGCIHMQQGRVVNMNIVGSAVTADQVELFKSHESWATFFRREYTQLVDELYGQTQTTVICDKCGGRSTSYQPWCVFRIPIPGAQTVGATAPTFNECVDKALETETLSDYECVTCAAKGPAHVEHSISKFPKTLFLMFKRFINSGTKVKCRIPYDVDSVDFSKWRSWASIQAQPVYRVTSTVEHLGGSRGGHYCMRTRDADVATGGTGGGAGRWLVYDDTSVGIDGLNGATTPDTYVLVLERITP